jgi:hypothetical protein
LKGVFPNNNSYKNIPNVHQSTALPCPSPVSVWAGSEANNLLGAIETLRHLDIAEPPDNLKLSSSQKYLLFQTRRETQLHCNMPLYAKQCLFRVDNKIQMQSLELVYLPFMISGAKYSWVPTNDIDRAPVGSAMSSGREVTCANLSGSIRSITQLQRHITTKNPACHLIC